jgi:hypothetical protein
MGARLAFFEGFFGKKWAEMGHLKAAKAGKKAPFWVGERLLEGAKWFSGFNRTLCPTFAMPENQPGGGETGERSWKSYATVARP